jgi:hypothetical protein
LQEYADHAKRKIVSIPLFPAPDFVKTISRPAKLRNSLRSDLLKIGSILAKGRPEIGKTIPDLTIDQALLCLSARAGLSRFVRNCCSRPDRTLRH